LVKVSRTRSLGISRGSLVKEASVPASLGQSTPTPEGAAAHHPEMRLADFCNPHFKDEHPSPAWLPVPEAPENRAIHVSRLTSPDSLPKAGQPMTATKSESAVALTSVSPNDVAQAPSPSNQDRFHHQPVKAEGFHSPERLPPTSDPPQALSRTPRFRLVRFSTPLRIPAEQSAES
jgi:hypothetical protein